MVCKGAAKAIEYYERALGAKELMRFDAPDGSIAHAELQIGDSQLMLADEFPDGALRSPLSVGGASVSMMLYVPDADATFQCAVAAGARVLRGMQDQFYGDRSGTVEDPFGHIWTIGTHVEDVPPVERWSVRRITASPRPIGRQGDEAGDEVSAHLAKPSVADREALLGGQP